MLTLLGNGVQMKILPVIKHHGIMKLAAMMHRFFGMGRIPISDMYPMILVGYFVQFSLDTSYEFNNYRV